ncbi:hypothetical protein ABWI04_42150, partial [Actinomadura sp. NPDC000929]
MPSEQSGSSRRALLAAAALLPLAGCGDRARPSSAPSSPPARRPAVISQPSLPCMAAGCAETRARSSREAAMGGLSTAFYFTLVGLAFGLVFHVANWATFTYV